VVLSDLKVCLWKTTGYRIVKQVIFVLWHFWSCLENSFEIPFVLGMSVTIMCFWIIIYAVICVYLALKQSCFACKEKLKGSKFLLQAGHRFKTSMWSCAAEIKLESWTSCVYYIGWHERLTLISMCWKCTGDACTWYIIALSSQTLLADIRTILIKSCNILMCCSHWQWISV